MSFDSPEEAVVFLDDCSTQMRHAYWQDKNLEECLTIALHGIESGDEAVQDFPDSLFDILSCVKRLCYDVASFTWIGWDEVGIHPTASDSDVGLAMAKRNLQLAIRLDKGDLPTSRAYWMVGAHLLTKGKLDSALDEFDEAETYAVLSGSKPDILLCQGFMLLCQKLLGTVQEEILSTHLEQMSREEDSAPFAEQIETVVRVLSQ